MGPLKIVSRNGFKSIFNPIFTPTISTLPSIRFPTNNINLLETENDGDNSNPPLSAWLASTFVQPNRFKSISREGVGTPIPVPLPSGLRVTLLGIMPYAGLSFTTYETLKAQYVQPGPLCSAELGIGGGGGPRNRRRVFFFR